MGGPEAIFLRTEDTILTFSWLDLLLAQLPASRPSPPPPPNPPTYCQ